MDPDEKKKWWQHRTERSNTQSFLQQEVVRLGIAYGPFAADGLSYKPKPERFFQVQDSSILYFCDDFTKSGNEQNVGAMMHSCVPQKCKNKTKTEQKQNPGVLDDHMKMYMC